MGHVVLELVVVWVTVVVLQIVASVVVSIWMEVEWAGEAPVLAFNLNYSYFLLASRNRYNFKLIDIAFNSNSDKNSNNLAPLNRRKYILWQGEHQSNIIECIQAIMMITLHN